jgi:hypothetical protein
MKFAIRRQWEQQQEGGGGDQTQPAIPTPTPPPSANNAASLAVEQATYRQALRRKTIQSTITPGSGGGANGGWTPPAGAPK